MSTVTGKSPVIYDAVLLIFFQTVKQFFFTESFYEFCESIGLDFSSFFTVKNKKLNLRGEVFFYEPESDDLKFSTLLSMIVDKYNREE